MSRTTLQLIVMALLLIIAQVVVLNHICLFRVAVPFAFVYVLLRMPINMSQNLAITISFLLGLTIDIFSDTQGMNSLACTFIGALRKPVLRLYFPREDELSDPCPSISSLGFVTYAKYALSMCFIYCTIIFIIEAFSFVNIALLILSIIFSTLLTTILLLGIDSLTLRRHEKRL